MAKVINAYRNFTASEIKARATVPDQVDMTVVSTTVECEKITTAKVRNAIGASFNAWGAFGLSSLVNKWSGFGPTVRSVSGGLLVNSVGAAPHGAGEFAGYNHAAPTPHFNSGGSNTYTLLQSGSDLVLSCVLDIGEVKYNDITGVANQPTHIHFSVWDGASWVTGAAKVIAIANAVDEGGGGNSNSIIDFSQSDTRITLSGLTSTKTYTCKIWFCDSDTFDYTGANKVFEMTQFASWTHQARIKSANHFYVNAPYNNSAATGASTFTSGRWDVNTASINLSAGTILMNYLTLNAGLGSGWDDTGYNSLDLRFKVESGYYDSSGVWQGTLESTSSYYVTNEPWNSSPPTQAINIASYFDIWTPSTGMDTSGYGYRIIIDCNVD